MISAIKRRRSICLKLDGGGISVRLNLRYWFKVNTKCNLGQLLNSTFLIVIFVAEEKKAEKKSQVFDCTIKFLIITFVILVLLNNEKFNVGANTIG